MAAILKQMKRGLFRAFIKLSAPAIVRQLHRGILGRASKDHELSTCVESIRKSGGRIEPVLKRLLKSEEFRSRVSRIRMTKPPAKDTVPEQRMDDLPKSPPPDSTSSADLRKKIAFLGASVTAQTYAHETGEMTGYVEAFRKNHAAILEFGEVSVHAYPETVYPMLDSSVRRRFWKKNRMW